MRDKPVTPAAKAMAKAREGLDPAVARPSEMVLCRSRKSRHVSRMKPPPESPVADFGVLDLLGEVEHGSDKNGEPENNQS